ncbi:chondroitin sulfate synthase 1-like [Styela clava]
MATCTRRTLCSAKSLTGLLCGVIMGFLMGSIHLAIMNSQFYYTKIGNSQNPCLSVLLQPRSLEDDDPLPENFSPIRYPEKQKHLRYDEMVQLNYKLDDYNGYDQIEGDDDINGLLQDGKIDKIYEIDLSRVGLPKKNDLIGSPHAYSSKKTTQKSLDHHQDVVIQTKRNHHRHDKFDRTIHEQEKFLYVGVMTAGKYVGTRGKAILDTWAPKINGKVELFVGETAILQDIQDEKAMNVVRLKRVNDNDYPPQKKSFMMLKHMYDQYLNGYEWFMRADDDAYVKADKLERFLRRLNSSEPLFLGQTGLGNEEERGKLTLDHGENYCMGGPGMIFSREVIRRIAPHIRTCLRNMYTNHEDVEISRCVSKYADVKCVWSYEMRELFYEHYSKRLGYIDPQEGSFGNSLIDAITLHPNKKPEYQRRLHNYFLSQKIKLLQAKLTLLYRDLVEMDNAVGRTSDMEELMLGSPLTLNRFRPTEGSAVIPWMIFSDRFYQLSTDTPRRNIPSYVQASVKDIVLQIMGMMNGNSKVRGRVISFKRVNYGYMRVNPLFGCEYVLDLLLQYNRYRGKKVSLPVRRHAYLQQTFSRTELYEDSSTHLEKLVKMKSLKFQGWAINSFVGMIPKHIKSLFGLNKKSDFAPDFDMISYQDQGAATYDDFVKIKPEVALHSRFTQAGDGKLNLPTVNIIIPLTGRFLTFQRFMSNLEKIALFPGNPVSVLIMLFMPQDANPKIDMRLTQELIQEYKVRYPKNDIRYVPVAGEFSRGLALEVGASQFSGDSLLLFCDVDVIFNSKFLDKCRSNTIRGQTVYYPVLFSEFDPKLSGFNTNVKGERADHFEIIGNSGYWRSFGYGLLCVYQSDFASTGGFDTSIRGWGFEDVDLYGKFVMSESKNSEDEIKPASIKLVTAKPMRVQEPDLIHAHHPSHCDPELSEKQLSMCRASRATSIMSVSRLYEKWQKNVVSHIVQQHDQPVEHQNNRQNFKEDEINKYYNSKNKFNQMDKKK